MVLDYHSAAIFWCACDRMLECCVLFVPGDPDQKMDADSRLDLSSVVERARVVLSVTIPMDCVSSACGLDFVCLT
jgi:hypothetical protein